MTAWPPPAHHPGRPPVRIRWPRRIAGVLGTLVLLGIAIWTASMILDRTKGSSDEVTTAVTPPSAKAKAKAKSTTKTAAAAPTPAPLTAAQKQARSAAVQSLASQGYEPVRTADFNPRHELRVLIGYRTGDTTGPRRAFFFRPSGYVGSDSTAPSTNLKVAGSGKDWVTLSYGIYATGDQPSHPSGGHVKVRFGWNGTSVSAVGGTIPQTWERVLSGT